LRFIEEIILRVLLRIVGWILIVLIAVAGGAAWWLFVRPLPEGGWHVSLPGLQHEVTVSATFGEYRTYARGRLRTWPKRKGTLMAQDRLWQMDLLRRVARGQLSEIVGARR